VSRYRLPLFNVVFFTRAIALYYTRRKHYCTKCHIAVLLGYVLYISRAWSKRIRNTLCYGLFWRVCVIIEAKYIVVYCYIQHRPVCIWRELTYHLPSWWLDEKHIHMLPNHVYCSSERLPKLYLLFRFKSWTISFIVSRVSSITHYYCFAWNLIIFIVHSFSSHIALWRHVYVFGAISCISTKSSTTYVCEYICCKPVVSILT
jgi:hypothetical protein